MGKWQCMFMVKYNIQSELGGQVAMHVYGKVQYTHRALLGKWQCMFMVKYNIHTGPCWASGNVCLWLSSISTKGLDGQVAMYIYGKVPYPLRALMGK